MKQQHVPVVEKQRGGWRLVCSCLGCQGRVQAAASLRENAMEQVVREELVVVEIEGEWAFCVCVCVIFHEREEGEME